MNLMDHFNIFQKVAKSLRLSANARSLYVAVLGEFNSARYPVTLNLSNRLLQDISGINAESSFHSARNALLNARLIKAKKQFYTLSSEDALKKIESRLGVSVESPWSQSGVSLEPPWSPLGAALDNTTFLSIPKNKVDEEVDEDEAPATPASSTRVVPIGDLNPQIYEVWTLYEGENLSGGQILDMYSLEREYGVELLVECIKEASRSNTRQRLSYNFVKKILENRAKGVKHNERSFGRKTGGGYGATVDNSQYGGFDGL